MRSAMSPGRSPPGTAKLQLGIRASLLRKRAKLELGGPGRALTWLPLWVYSNIIPAPP